MEGTTALLFVVRKTWIVITVKGLLHLPRLSYFNLVYPYCFCTNRRSLQYSIDQISAIRRGNRRGFNQSSSFSVLCFTYHARYHIRCCSIDWKAQPVPDYILTIGVNMHVRVEDIWPPCQDALTIPSNEGTNTFDFVTSLVP